MDKGSKRQKKKLKKPNLAESGFGKNKNHRH
jgi:hypothetical protein